MFGLRLDTDDMSGAWDVTIDLADGDLDLMPRLAPLAAAPDFKMTIGKSVYDLAAWPEDRKGLAAAYLEHC